VSNLEIITNSSIKINCTTDIPKNSYVSFLILFLLSNGFSCIKRGLVFNVIFKEIFLSFVGKSGKVKLLYLGNEYYKHIYFRSYLYQLFLIK
jgi:hypothetical protein